MTLLKYILTLMLLALAFVLMRASFQVLTTTVFVSDRLEACEAQGGKYRLFWSDFRGSYKEMCELLETEIENF